MRILTLLSLGAVLVAQGPQTFVVDVGNGPGTQFTDITTAVNAVPDGSILIVRPGNYAPLTVNAKSITILADSARCPTASIHNTQATQPVVVRGVLVGAPWSSVSSWRVHNAAGRVVIDGAGDTISMYPLATVVPMTITQSAQVFVARLHAIGRSSIVSDSNVVFEQCSFTGQNFLFWQPSVVFPFAALQVTASNVQFVHGSLHGGGMGDGEVDGAPAVWLSGGSLRVLGSSADAIAGGFGMSGTAFAIEGTGVARVDPAVNLVGGANVTLSRPEMASLVTQGARPGGTLVANRFGPVGSVYAIALSLPAPATTISAVVDPLWIDPTWNVVEAVGLTLSTAPVVVSRPVPNVPSLAGVTLTWQAADITATGIIAVTNPSPTLVW